MLVRTPAFSICATLQESWPELKEAIRMASPDFFKEIADIEFHDIHTLSQRHQLTIYKYFNRSRYRAVPFGAFCSVSLLDNNHFHPFENIVINQQQTLCNLPDWQQKAKIKYTFQDLLNANANIQANSTWYMTAENIRFVSTNQVNKFEMNDIAGDDDILFALELAKNGISIRELIENLKERLGGKKYALSFVEGLAGSGLVFTSFDANIIGEDYFERLGYKIDNSQAGYTISLRSIAGALPKNLLKHIPELVERLDLMEQPEQISKEMQDFRNRFKEKFDLEEVPLMIALDPEFGVGYGNMESAASTSTLIDALLSGKLNETTDKFRETFAAAFRFDISAMIDIAPLLPRSENGQSNAKLANSMSCIFSIADGLVVLDRIGGYSFNQFAGRFNIADTKILETCKEQAAIEGNANPEVVFFDIGYLSEINVDNVNRRNSIYDHELPIMSYSTSSGIITLTELYIRMSGNEIVLFSRRLGKRVVPRMATAYNFERSDLPIFKFLCDLMHYGLKTELLPQLPALMPGLKQYPRMQYRNIILARAQWTVSVASIKSLTTEGLREHLKARNVPRFLRTGMADQTLLLDMDSDQDTAFLLALLRSKKDAIVEEAIVPETSVITDQYGKPYLGQFIAALNHHENVYYKARPVWANQVLTTTFFAPGSQWLYCEIYSHTNYADELLFLLSEFAKTHKQYIEQWFFIRYDKPSDHIRLRLLLTRSDDAPVLLTNLHQLLAEPMAKGVVADFQVKAYKREMERYGFAGIEEVEALFCYDTQYTLQILNLPDPLKYQLSILLLNYILSKLSAISTETVQSWLCKIREGYNQEYGIRGDGFKIINQYIRDQHLMEERALDQNHIAAIKTISDHYARILDKLTGIRVMPLLTDLFHMHINRLFCDHQRLHEAMIYNIKETADRRTKGTAKSKIPV